jgi:hypothetical protein
MTTATTDPLGKKSGESIQDHKARVVEASRAHAEAQKVAARATSTRPPEGFPKPPGTPSSIPEFMQNLGVQAPQEPPVTPAPSGAATTQPPAPNGSQEPEWQKVAREKGWKTPDDAVRSYQALEREFHERNQRTPTPPAVPPYVPPVQPQYVAPYPQYQPPQPVYPPPVPAWQPQNVVRQLAGKYRIPDEDAERLVPFVAEISQAAAENALMIERSRTGPVIQNMAREIERNKEMNEVANDPAMRVPRVQYEVNKLLSENPTVFTYEAQPLRWALDRALRNIAQESLRADQNYNASQPNYPNQPPVTAGSGSQTRGGQPPAGGPSIDLAGNYFKLKTSAEKLEVLRQMGVAAE